MGAFFVPTRCSPLGGRFNDRAAWVQKAHPSFPASVDGSYNTQMNQLVIPYPNNRSLDERVFLRSTSNKRLPKEKKEPAKFLEFFAGSGLVAEGLSGYFQVAWANDICAKKAKVYTVNHGVHSSCV
ncbi:MAG: hypothetical protein WC091_04855 [Sulfuricellaceae bacterium]